MKVITSGRRPQLRGNKVVVTTGNPCLCGDCGGGGGGGTTGACCDEFNNCTITTEAGCAGTFQGIGTVCDPNPCSATGACCINGACSILSSADCSTAFGYYFGDGTDCDPDPCVTITCCLGPIPTFNSCDTILPSDCAARGGAFGVPGFFCWPEGDYHAGLQSCCVDGDNTCITDNGLDHFCCTPPNTCCIGTDFSAFCCSPVQTCCGDFGCCDPGQTCVEFEGCV